MTLEERLAGLTLEEARDLEYELGKFIRQAEQAEFEAGIAACPRHEYAYSGHGHNSDWYTCGKCGHYYKD